MFFRYYSETIQERLAPGRVLVLYGPRRVGKTFLVQQFLQEYQGRVFSGVGDDALVREILESESVSRITSSFADYDLVVIDEAQKIANVGQGLKILVDHLPAVKVIATGSSSFDLANKVGEPLTGRKTTLLLFPLSVLELRTQHGALDTRNSRSERLFPPCAASLPAAPPPHAHLSLPPR